MGDAAIATRAGDETIYTSGFAGVFTTFAVTFDSLSTAGITFATPTTSFLETSSAGLYNYAYILTGTDKTKT